MEEKKARDALRNRQNSLKDVIVAAGLVNIVNLCEEKGLITTPAKDDILSRRTEDHRAYRLLDTIRKSLVYDTSTVLDKFLCIIYNEGGVAGQGIAEEIGGEYGIHHLQNLSALTSQQQSPSLPASGRSIASPSSNNQPANQPELSVKNLEEQLKKLVHWEGFALQLPGIEPEHIETIKRNERTVENQKRALFVKWIAVNPGTSWEAVIQALEKNDHNRLAAQLRRFLSQTSSSSFVTATGHVGSQQGVQSTGSVAEETTDHTTGTTRRRTTTTADPPKNNDSNNSTGETAADRPMKNGFFSPPYYCLFCAIFIICFFILLIIIIPYFYSLIYNRLI